MGKNPYNHPVVNRHTWQKRQDKLIKRKLQQAQWDEVNRKASQSIAWGLLFMVFIGWVTITYIR